MNVTQDYAEFVANTEYEDLPRDVVAQTRRCVLDWSGAAIIGSQTRAGSTIRDLVKGMGGVEESTIPTETRKASCLNAALANGTMSHTLEVDDYGRSAIMHIGVGVIPAAMALAEKKDVDLKRLITAIVLGYETSIRVSHSLIPSHYQYWHVTGTAGTFGAAVAASKVLDLDKQGVINALGNAGTQAAGIMEFTKEAAMSKSLHPGKAAHNGVLSALLAEKSFTGASTILEGDRGYFKATSTDPKPAVMLKDLGKKFAILSNVSFKPHAACGHTVAAIDATLGLVQEYKFKSEDVSKIHLRTYTVAAKMAPTEIKNGFGAKFHLPYAVAISIIDRRAGIEQFTDERVRDPAVLGLIKKCTLEVDPELDRGPWLGGGPCIVEITLKGGTKYTRRVDYAKGNPENPMSDEELQQKFRKLATDLIGRDAVEEFIDRTCRLERLQHLDELTSLLRTKR